MMRAVKQQAANALLSTPQPSVATDAQKQELAEALLVQAALLDGLNTNSQGHPEQLKALAAASKHGAMASGLDLSTMTLTDKGFRPVRPH